MGLKCNITVNSLLLLLVSAVYVSGDVVFDVRKYGGGIRADGVSGIGQVRENNSIKFL